MLAVVAVAAGGCGAKPRPKPPSQVYGDGVRLEQRANRDPRKTREALYDEALAKYQEACTGGHLEACTRRDELDRLLRERRGVCATPEDCFDQAVVWMPSTRGEERLRALCLGERLTFDYGDPPPAWEPDGRACVAVADYYREAVRLKHARFFYDKGCVVAGAADACRRGARLDIDAAHAFEQTGDTRGKGRALRIAAEKAERGCELGDAASCVLLSEIGLAHQRLLFPDAFALRFAAGADDTRAHLDAARAAAARACDLGDKDACTQVGAVDEEIARVENIHKMGCAFLDDCDSGELCNRKTGICESRKAKGSFYRAYEQGIQKFGAKDFASARKAFERARSMNPELPGPWRWLGLIALRQERYADCRDLFAEALRLNPESRYARGMEQIRQRCVGAQPKQ